VQETQVSQPAKATGKIKILCAPFFQFFYSRQEDRTEKYISEHHPKE
jgi:hypothetical protein